MPSDNNAQAPQKRQSTSSIASEQSQTASPSSPPSPHPQQQPSTTPPAQQHHRSKHAAHKHVVSSGRTHTHARAASGKGPAARHAHDASTTDMRKLLGGRTSSSATNLRKRGGGERDRDSNPHGHLRRNRSSADVTKRTTHDNPKRPVSVHFEIGDQDRDDGWEEASSTASPTVSRSVASSRAESARPSATNSQAQSPVQSHAAAARAAEVGGGGGISGSQGQAPGGSQRGHARASTEGKIIAERLLQRTPSYNTTKMSLATATPTSAGYLPDDVSRSQDSTTAAGRDGVKDEVISRFVGGSGTPSDGSPFLRSRPKGDALLEGEDVKRVRSMGNLSQTHAQAGAHDGDENGQDEESALLRRPRQAQHAYVPPQQSRTQQKLWLQRASSNIEPAQMNLGLGMGMGMGIGIGMGMPGRGVLGAPSSSLVDGDAGDPRTRIQLERTGLEYLVVRRHQDPVGAALRRLDRVPGVRGIPASKKKADDRDAAAAPSKFGLSQSLKDPRVRVRGEGEGAGASGTGGEAQRQSEDDKVVTTLLRSLWEKSYDMSASAE